MYFTALLGHDPAREKLKRDSSRMVLGGRLPADLSVKCVDKLMVPVECRFPINAAESWRMPPPITGS